MLKVTKLTFFLLVSICISFNPTVAKTSFDYPELMVSPKASERLHLEAIKEKGYDAFLHLPVQISALTTFTTGILQFGNVDQADDPDERSPLIGTIIGGGWLALSFALGNYYKPYYRGYRDIAKMPTKTKHQRLMKERLAEESIERAASVGRRITWLSVLSNLGASAYMLTTVKSDTSAQEAGYLASAASFAPLLFQYHWVKVACEQENYKKKIYAPIAFNPMVYDNNANKIVPGASLSFTF